MIDPIQSILLALMQGLTEFLPISSSAHLVIPSLVLGWPDQGLAFDVAVHVGTLLAVMLYYRRDLLSMLSACTAFGGDPESVEQRRVVGLLALASIPAAVLGFAGDTFIETHFRSLPVIASTTLVFGLLLGLADRRARTVGVALTWRIALLVGLAQAVALIPGVSRSGVTITAALLLGMSRQASARFSFLMSIPIIGGAGLLKTLDMLESPVPVDWLWLGVAALVAGATAYACIRVFLTMLERVGLMPFVYYRIALALVLYAIWVA